eukprot:jgi/Mesvir1/24792/Mv22044-RA.1
MGCVCSVEAKRDAERERAADSAAAPQKLKIRRAKSWTHTEPLTRQQLERMRAEFWDTAPHYGGHREIWDALQAAVNSDPETAALILESAGVMSSTADLSVSYDVRGCKYELPKYVLRDPTNLISLSPNKSGDGGSMGAMAGAPPSRL